MSEGSGERRINPESRLAELGLVLAMVPSPAGSYVPVVIDGGVAHVAGQVAVRDGVLVAKGRLGAEVDLELGRRCARQCAINVLAQLRRSLGSLDRVIASFSSASSSPRCRRSGSTHTSPTQPPRS